MGCGFYIASSHPETMGRLTEDDIFEEMVREIIAGIEDSPGTFHDLRKEKEDG
jgi:predicted metal-dependent phosphotriesterase family hydrolase